MKYYILKAKFRADTCNHIGSYLFSTSLDHSISSFFYLELTQTCDMAEKHPSRLRLQEDNYLNS